MHRRNPLATAAAVLAALCLFGAEGCRSSATTTPPEPALKYFEVVTGSTPPAPGESLPLLIALHGLGDTPQLFFRAFGTDMPGRVRMIFAQGPITHGEGYSWFDIPEATNALVLGRFGEGVSQSGERVANLIDELVREHAPPSPPIVFGYSQGGILSFYLAARHADKISAAVPIAGLLPRSLSEIDGVPAPTFAFHGALDARVPVEAARETVAAFRAAGGTAELREYSHLGHQVSLALVRDAIRKLAELAGVGPPGAR